MKQEHIDEIKAITILALAIVLFVSLISFVPEDLPWYTSQPNIPAKNLVSVVGAYLAGILLFIFGYSSYFIIPFLGFWSWNKFTSREINFSFPKFLGSIILFCVISSFFSLLGPQDSGFRFERAGIVGLVL